MISSKELLRRTGLSRATLNNYIALGILPRPEVRPEDGAKGRAARVGYFPGAALDRIRRVGELKREGHTMADIASMLGGDQSGGTRDRAGPAAGTGDQAQAPAGTGPDRTEANRTEANRTEPDRAEPDRAEPDRAEPDRAEPAKAEPAGTGPQRAEPAAANDGAPGRPVEQRADGGLRLTLDAIDYPAYMANNNFEVEWSNGPADAGLLGHPRGLPREIEECNLFRLFLADERVRRAEGLPELLRFHLAIAKKRLPKAALWRLGVPDDDPVLALASEIYDEVEPVRTREVRHTTVNLAPPGEPDQWHSVYASFFREGVFFAYAPSTAESEDLLTMLARRDLVIRDILKHRRPYLTPLAVLVADLQDSVKICAELPPEEYFELINQIWMAMEPKLRRYYATHGKHVGDGMVYYFFPQPDCSHVANAVRCAHEMRETMREISRQWKARKNWLNDLVLNIGLDEGEEWFGSYQTPTHLEFTVLGETINMAARISDFARDGAIWTTKRLLGKLTTAERERVRYGIRRATGAAEEVLVPATYSRLSNLIDLEDARHYKFRDIGALTLTEILDVQGEADGGGFTVG